MASFSCGDALRFSNYPTGSSGCLVRFPDFSDRALMLTAGHVVLPTFARAGDAITSYQSNEMIGRLFSWTSIDGDPTADAALIWVDPAKVSLQLRGIGIPSGINLMPTKGTRVRIIPHEGQQSPRDTLIRDTNVDINVIVSGPGWPQPVRMMYQGQMTTEALISEGGDSGAIVVDDQNRVVGMVVAGNADAGTVITPISAILANKAWGNRQLELLTDLSGMTAPPLPVTLPELPELDVKIDWLTPKQQIVAREVATTLQAGGFGVLQQAAALGSAVGESSLDPFARNHTAKEDSVGLFQLNRTGGRGFGRSVEELQRIDVQCAVVLDWAKKVQTFLQAEDLAVAISEFVGDFERPKDIPGAIKTRLTIAKKFLPA